MVAFYLINVFQFYVFELCPHIPIFVSTTHGIDRHVVKMRTTLTIHLYFYGVFDLWRNLDQGFGWSQGFGLQQVNWKDELMGGFRWECEQGEGIDGWSSKGWWRRG